MINLKEILALESPNVNAYTRELSFVKSEEKKSKLMSLLRQAAYKNVSGSASSTGKYHPKFSNGDWGLSRHTKAVVKFVMVICDAFPELDQDTMVIAAIAHDMVKYASDDEKYTAKHHADDAADLLQQAGLTEESRLVRSHMGRWDAERDSSGKTKAPQKFDEKMLHLADYFASKKFININFDSDNNILEESKIKTFKQIYLQESKDYGWRNRFIAELEKHLVLEDDIGNLVNTVDKMMFKDDVARARGFKRLTDYVDCSHDEVVGIWLKTRND